MESLAMLGLGWASGIVTVVVWAIIKPYAPQQPRGKAPIGFRGR